MSRIVLAGNPNTGKSTLFNRLTGGSAKVGNYPGITVSPYEGKLALASGAATLVDLPGTYSLTARSLEEQLAGDVIDGRGDHPQPDLVVLCADATNLVRNLYLLLQVQELGRNVIVALTMLDEAGGSAPDAIALRAALGCRVLPVNPRTGAGVDALKAAIDQAVNQSSSEPLWRFEPSADLQTALADMQEATRYSRGAALWALLSVGDDELVGISDEGRAVAARVADRFDDEVVEGRYRWLDDNIAPLIDQENGEEIHASTDRLDRVLLHPVLGFGVFLALMTVLFQGLFTWSDPFINIIESGFGWLAGTILSVTGPTLLGSFLADGLIGGVGSVLVFLPQIMLLFLLLSLMEDTGYMARVAYLMDRVMKPLGLHGRAFVPMLSGFACAVPAIMATRTMERKRDRFLTMMIIPLMTCSARLPVYTLIIAALFPAGRVFGIFPTRGLMMTGMYLFSVVIALIAGFVMSRTLLPAPPSPLVLELPPYRLPRPVDVWRQTWRGTQHFLKDAGGIILLAAIVMWGALTFPRIDPGEVVGLGDEAVAAAQLEQSVAGRMGHAIEPIIRPVGWDWKIGVGMIGAFAAREVFISTLGEVYALGSEVDEADVTLREHMKAEVKADGKPVWSPLVGLSVMVFIALGAQCTSTLAVLKRETKTWRWPVFLFVWMTTLAYVASLIVYQGGRALGFG
ncbi:MAG: ferrous iron transport protein B [Myxococcota bacterium]